MLQTLEIKNFRVLEDFKVSKLGRVNLIVGKNNSGKSSILEALQIYAADGQERLMQDLAVAHDERFLFEQFTEAELRSGSLPYAGFFSNRHLQPEDAQGIVIGASSTSADALGINVKFRTWQHPREINSPSTPFPNNIMTVSRALLSHFRAQDLGAYLVVSKGGQQILPLVVSIDVPTTNYRIPHTTPCSVIPTRFVSFNELADAWDQISLTDNELVVSDALKLITPEFEKLSFIKASESGIQPQGSIRRTAIVRLAGIPHPVPINSMGDGMLRILQLILKVFPAKDGFLLIDEFENGLHYSVQEKVWRMVFELAEKLNIQVFATTHSWDCITSFAKVAQQRENDDGILFRVGRSVRTSDKGKVIATVFSGTSLFDLTQADIEVR